MIVKHIKSYKHAKDGFLNLLTVKNHNFVIELIVTPIVILLGLAFNIDHVDFLFLIISCGFVLTTEILNTSIEAACDAIDLNHNPQIKIAKDVAAAAVVMAGFTSLITGLVIFIPKMVLLVSSFNK